MKKFYCPLHGSTENVRVAELLLAPNRVLRVHLECLTCPDHLGTQVFLPLEVLQDYDLPEIGSNIYHALRTELRKRGIDDTKNNPTTK